jgi:nucleotide-binding universal stress UspA family protein
MSRILALIDASIYAESVCDHAAWVAERLGWPVDLLHVLGKPEAGGLPLNLSGNLNRGLRRRRERDQGGELHVYEFAV